jgi:hypothetical protein
MAADLAGRPPEAGGSLVAAEAEAVDKLEVRPIAEAALLALEEGQAVA